MSEASGRILLAEDRAVDQRVATAMLEHLGYEVDVVADGEEAVDAAVATPHRAILMDCQLPVLDGYQATEQIRIAEGTTRHTPIVAVTGSGSPSDRRRCLAAGMDDHLVKPLTLKELTRVLTRWIPSASPGTIVTDLLEPVRLTSSTQRNPRHPVLDMEVIGGLQRLGDSVGEDLIRQLTLIFIEDSEAAIVALRGALGAGDAAAVVRHAHALSGASSNLGATDLARMFASLEAVDVAGGLLGSATTLDAIEAEFGRVRSALGSLMVKTP